jgi:histidyl-tRNA synthetase
MLYRAPRGTADILPQEQNYWRHIEQRVAEIARLYGYERIDVPVFEDAGLFTRSVGEGTDIVEKEMYAFKDKGGNKLTLIPEGTASCTHLDMISEVPRSKHRYSTSKRDSSPHRVFHRNRKFCYLKQSKWQFY